MSDDLTPEERALLDLVPPAEPPPGFSARVMASAAARGSLSGTPGGASYAAEGLRPAPRKLRAPAAALFVGLGALAAAAVAVIGSLASAGDPPPSSGTLAEAPARSSIAIGHRGVAVAEASSALEWRVAADGAATLTQTAGNIFYRVEPGGPFVVSTSAGEVRVTGTCFRVEVSDVKTSTLGGAAAGALAATLVTVTVYEGRVMASSAGGGAPVAVEAGESARLDGLAPPRRVAPLPSASPSLAARVVAEATLARPGPRPVLPPNMTPEALYAAHGALAKEADALRGQVEALSRDLARAQEKGRNKSYDIPPEELRAMAEQCELRWDTVPVTSQEASLSQRSAERAGLSEEERAAVEKRLRASQKQLVDTVRALYVEVTGDTTGGSLAPGAMLDEIEDKTPREERQRVFQQLARERAGMIAPPPPGQPEDPYTRLYRALTSSGDALEAAIAEDLGPETARRLRDLNNGWGSKNGSSNGCPSPGSPSPR